MTSFNHITDDDIQVFRTYLGRDLNALNVYQRIATKTAIYPGAGSPFGMAYVGLKLNGEAGEFAEHVGKAFRDDKYGDTQELTEARRVALIKEVGDVLWYLSAACNELGITLSSVALQNLQKLNDRSKRGKLSGSGDNR